MYPLVSIIILNWNGWKDTLECLESIYQIKYPNYKVILVDNHSQDQSLQKIRQYCQGKVKIETKFVKYQENNKPIQIKEITNREAEKTIFKQAKANSSDRAKPALTLIKNDENYGFARGNNIAMEYTLKMESPHYILLLNNDTVVTPEFLDLMVEAGEAREKIGMVGGKLLNAFNPAVIDSTGHVIRWGRMVDRGHGEFDKGQYDNHPEVMGIMAAAALYKKEMLLDVGLLDTDYVTLGEDADLSWRAHDQGWKAEYASKAIIYHKRGQAITKKDVIPEMTVLSLKNTTEYVSRYGNVKQKLAFLLLITKEALFVMTGSIIGRNEVSMRKYSSILMKSYSKIIKSI